MRLFRSPLSLSDKREKEAFVLSENKEYNNEMLELLEKMNTTQDISEKSKISAEMQELGEKYLS